jgi:hypothetical protein
VVDETDGTWGLPIEVPGAIISGDGGDSRTPGSRVLTVSCGAPGNCAAGGYYEASDNGGTGAFLVDEIGGTWGNAFEVSGAITSSYTQINSISCRSAGNCSAGGSLGNQPLVVDEKNGTWGGAMGLPAIERDDGGQFGGVATVSCGSAGNCAAGGSYVSLNRLDQGTRYGFVDNESSGVWRPAETFPATARGFVSAISCSAPGDCSAGGQFTIGAAAKTNAVLVNEVHGVWSPPIAIPGAQQLAKAAEILSISCGAPGECAAVGWETVPNVGFVTNEEPSSPPVVTSVSPSRGSTGGGTTVVIHGSGLRDALEVTFGPHPGLDLRSVGATSLVVTSPPGLGAVVVRVTAEAGVSPRTSLARFTYVAPRRIAR